RRPPGSEYHASGGWEQGDWVSRWPEPPQCCFGIDRAMAGRRMHHESASLCAMSAQSYALFETPVGWCGIVWSACGVAGVQLPERGENATRARLQRRYPGAQEAAPPPRLREAIEGVTRLLSGEGRDLSAIELDMRDIPPQRREIY